MIKLVAQPLEYVIGKDKCSYLPAFASCTKVPVVFSIKFNSASIVLERLSIFDKAEDT